MREFFEIDGYWKDDKETFQGYIVTNFEDIPDETDDDIFYYGFDEQELKDCIELGEETIHEFVITGYTKIIC